MSKKTEIISRSNRKDGEATKTRIIECAGRLFAENGYDGTTGKDICLAADVNAAAVNYYFGGREQLYLAVLEKVHDYLLNINIIKEISLQNISAEQKLDKILTALLKYGFDRKDWHIRLWLKELLHPSPCIDRIILHNCLPKIYILSDILKEALGYDRGNVRFHGAYFSLFAPFILALLARNSPVLSSVPVHYSQKEFISIVKENFFTTLAALKKTEIR